METFNDSIPMAKQKLIHYQGEIFSPQTSLKKEGEVAEAKFAGGQTQHEKNHL